MKKNRVEPYTNLGRIFERVRDEKPQCLAVDLDPKGSQQLLLERFAYTDVGTFGRLHLGGITLFTCEDPSRVGKSHIIEGLSTIGPYRYHKHGCDCYGVRDVPER